jgi:putative DNA primase/helicase
LDYVRVKPSNPQKDRLTGKTRKYEAPVGQPSRLYFPAGVGPEVLADNTVPLVIVEGEKKAIALAQAGFIAIAVSGVWSWCKKSDADGRPKELIPDFDQIVLDGRVVIIIFDSDAATNDKVLWAEWYFAETLTRTKRADVRVVRLPNGADDEVPGDQRPKIGADDFLLARGADALKDLIETATVPVRPNADDYFDRTDVGNARRLARFAANRIRYVADREVWFVFDGKRWVRDPKIVYVIGRAKAMLKKWKASALAKLNKAVQAVAEGKADKKVEDEAREELGFVLRTQDARAIRRMIDLARSEWALLVPRFADVFDRDQWLFNAANGTVDLRTGTVRPHSADDYLTKITTVAYDPTAEAPHYHRAVGAIFDGRPAVAEYVRRLSGVALTGDVSSQTLHVFHGEGANGKTLLLETWLHVGGEYAAKIPETCLLADEHGSRHPAEKAVLAGLRLAVASETGQGGRLNEQRTKELTGSDTITARFMHENFFEFPPSHKLILATNHRPRITGTDHADWRRVRLVPFAITFWNDADMAADPTIPRDPRFKADHNLKDLLRDLASGILRDMIEQACEFWRSGRILTPPTEVVVATSEYRRDEDTLGQFFHERVRPDETSTIRAKDLYAEYKRWADGLGIWAVGHKVFGGYAQKKLKWKKASSVRYYAVIENDVDGEDGVLGDNFREKTESEKSESYRAATGDNIPSSHPPESVPFVVESDDRGTWGAA